MEKKNKKPKDSNRKSINIKDIDISSLKNYFNQRTLIGVSLVGALVFVVVYVFVFLDYTQRTEALEQSNAALKQELTVLEEYYRNMNTYKQEIEEMQASINTILEEYPADAREEDILMLAVQMQEDHEIAYKSINMEEREGVYTVAYDFIAATGMEELKNDIIFTQKHATYVNETTYDELKDCIAQIYDSPNRIGIDNIVYRKNEESGTLDGNINLYFYSAAGTNKEYVAPDIAAYISGTDDLFQLGKVIKNNVSGNEQEAAESVEAEETE